MGKSNPNSVITFPEWAKEDLLMWRTFLDGFNGITIYNALWKGSSKDLSFFSDACPIGFGGTFKRHFIQGKFPPEWRRENIAVLELFPIYALVHIFAPSLVNGRIIFHCDNESIVHILNNKTSKDPSIMTLLRPLVLTLMNNNIVFKSVHVPGVENVTCDRLSRFQADAAFLRNHGLEQTPTRVPTEISPFNLTLRPTT